MKPPQPIFGSIFAFPPNRDTLGGTAYLLKLPSGNVLIDCPAWSEEVHQMLAQQGGLQQIFLTHRTGKGKAREVQQAFQCPILVQEQEAYLLPGLDIIPFQHTYELMDGARVFWTPGHSPGSACLYVPSYGGVLFSGRHLLPDPLGNPVPLKVAKTFHWKRQLQNVARLLHEFSPETLHYICPGANTGYLRGQKYIAHAYAKLSNLDFDAFANSNGLDSNSHFGNLGGKTVAPGDRFAP